MSDQAKTYRILVAKQATCHECRFESAGKYAERDARRHAASTGHIPTLEVAYDIGLEATPDPLLDASLRIREQLMPDARGMVPVRKGDAG